MKRRPKRKRSSFASTSLAYAAAGILVAFLGAKGLASDSSERDPSDSSEESEAGAQTFAEAVRAWLKGVDDDIDSTPAGLESIDTGPLSISDYLSDEEMKRALKWKRPNYAKQTRALGWSEKVFETPESFKTRVAFWHEIYGKYTTNQGLLHDSVYIGVVYGPVDFSAVMRDSDLSPREKQKAREKIVEDKRAEIMERLKRLSSLSSSKGLSGEDLRIWKLFEPISDPDKFEQAQSKSRVRFQLGQKDRFLLGIYQSGRYLREMEKIFRDEGLPIELTRLPFVESSFNVRARSRVGASGIWQFMPRTARPLLKMNREVDERNDPIKATKASAKMLKQNYKMLGTWPLAVTGYNHGPYGVKSIVNKLGTKDLTAIIRDNSSSSFGFASSNFYACFLAALEVEKNAHLYFDQPKWGPELQVADVRLRKKISYKELVEFFDGDRDMTELANPHLLQRVRQGKSSVPVGSFVRVPNGRLKIAEDLQKGRIPSRKLVEKLRATPAIIPAVGRGSTKR